MAGALSRFRDWLTGETRGLYPVSEEWDAALNRALDKHKVEFVSRYTARIGGMTLWVANYPYASGRPYGSIELDILPRRSTRKRLQHAVIAAATKQFDGGA